MIQACAGVEVIHQGPPEGDHMANGRVESAVREVKRQCRRLRISAEQNTNVHIADDSPLLSWLLSFAAQVVNTMRIGKMEKRANSDELDEDGESQWRNLERKYGSVKCAEDGVNSLASRRLKVSLLVIMIEQEQFCAKKRSCVRQKLDDTDTE